jgi:hypothetical protein
LSSQLQEADQARIIIITVGRIITTIITQNVGPENRQPEGASEEARLTNHA